MKNTYTLAKPISSETEALLLNINHVCRTLEIAFFVAGATAREVMLMHVHGRNSGRQTNDIDIAVYLKNWEQFTALKQAMIEQDAKEVRHNVHRMIWHGTEIDIIPFGPVAQNNKVAWPPDRDIILHVEGFQEVWQHAGRVEISAGNSIHFTSLPGLLLLKLFAWRDRGKKDSRDAVDIFKILTEYSRIEDERLYDNENWCERVDWVPERLGALLAGSDTAMIASAETCQELLALDKARLTDTIVRQDESVDAQKAENIIDDFWDGLAGN